MKKSGKINQGFTRKKKWPFVLLAIVLMLAGIYCGNLALFNVWQSAFSENAPYLDMLEFRAWTLILLSFTSIVESIAIIVLTIKNINRETKEEKQPHIGY